MSTGKRTGMWKDLSEIEKNAEEKAGNAAAARGGDSFGRQTFCEKGLEIK